MAITLTKRNIYFLGSFINNVIKKIIPYNNFFNFEKKESFFPVQFKLYSIVTKTAIVQFVCTIFAILILVLYAINKVTIIIVIMENKQVKVFLEKLL